MKGTETDTIQIKKKLTNMHLRDLLHFVSQSQWSSSNIPLSSGVVCDHMADTLGTIIIIFKINYLWSRQPSQESHTFDYSITLK